jgi:hypothetical protein
MQSKFPSERCQLVSGVDDGRAIAAGITANRQEIVDGGGALCRETALPKSAERVKFSPARTIIQRISV